MSICVTRRTLKNGAAIVGFALAASSLAGCSTFGLGDDPTVTGSVGYQGSSNLNQPMPSALGQGRQVADNGPYTPPEDIGSGSAPSLPMSGQGYQTYQSLPPVSAPQSHSFSSQDLPVIGASTSSRSLPVMSAQPAQNSMASISSAPRPLAAVPNLSVVPTGTYTHVIRSGESLYTIAKHYGVTAQSIMGASGISAPDKIFVGQRVVIPGRPDLLAAMDDAKPSPENDKLPVDSNMPVLASSAPDPLPMHERAHAHNETRVASLDNNAEQPVPLAGRILTPSAATAPEAPRAAATSRATSPVMPLATPIAKPAVSRSVAARPVAPTAPTMVASAPQAAPRVPMQEPATSGASKFRWPVSGKVVVDFAASKGTGINIAAPLGTPVKAVENGTVIYVGSGVEGYGNLILIRHANGYVSAYADLKDMTVQKNTVVGRGDTIGTAGMTGSVTSPQLHFELRKGATPVDPVPLLAG